MPSGTSVGTVEGEPDNSIVGVELGEKDVDGASEGASDGRRLGAAVGDSVSKLATSKATIRPKMSL